MWGCYKSEGEAEEDGGMGQMPGSVMVVVCNEMEPRGKEAWMLRLLISLCVCCSCVCECECVHLISAVWMPAPLDTRQISSPSRPSCVRPSVRPPPATFPFRLLEPTRARPPPPRATPL